MTRDRRPELGALLLNILVAALCAFLLWQNRLGALADAQARGVNLARLAELNVSSTLDRAGLALASTAIQLERQLTPQGIDERLLWEVVDAETAQVPEILRIGVFDVQGRQVCPSLQQRCLNLDVSGRDYFQQLKDHPGMAARLFGPYLNKVDGQSALVLARALRRSDGSFVGVAGAIIPVSGLQALMAAVDVGSSGRAGLRSESLGLLAPPPGPARSADVLAKLSKLSSEMLAALKANPNEGNVRAMSGFDGVERQTAYRRLPKHPLYVLVGLATDDFLAPWRQAAGWTAGFLLLFAAASLVIVRLIQGGMARQDKVRALLAQVTGSQDRLRRLYETTPAMLHAVDLDGRLVVVSDAWLVRLGHARSEVLGRPAVDFFTEASRRYVLSEGLRTLMDSGRQDDLELQMITSAGEMVDVLLSTKLERGADDTPLRIVAGLQDVTLRRRAEGALDEERQRLQNIIEGTGAGTWHHDLVTGDDSVNANYTTMLGYTPAEFQQAANVSFMDLVHAADCQGVEQARQAHLDGQTAEYEAEFRMRHRDGHWVWIYSRGSVFLRDKLGRPLAISGIHLDITQRKETERQLHRERQQLANILEGTNVGTWEWNVETGECKFNERWASIVGCGLAELGAGTIDTWSRLTHCEDVTPSAVQLERHFNGELPYYEAEVRVQHKHGHWIWVLDRGKLFSRSDDGRPRWMAGTRMDITRRKQAEESLRASQLFLDKTGRIGGVGGWEMDLQTQVIQWSDQTCRIHDLEPGHRPTLDEGIRYYAPEAQAVIEQAVQRCLRSGESFDLELPFVTAKGRAIWVRAVGEAEFSDGVPVRLVGAFQDITARRQTEDKLRVSEAFNTSVLDSLAAHIAVLDQDGVIVAVNEAWCRFGAENGSRAAGEGSIGTSYLGICADARIGSAGEESAAALNGIREVLAGTRSEFQMEYSCHAPHEQRWFCMSVTPMDDVRRGVVVSHENITQRKKMEEALRASQEFLDRTGRIGGVGGWALDLVTQELQWSDQTCRIHDLPAGHRPTLEEAVGYYAPESRLVVQGAIDHCLATGQAWDLELRLFTASAREIWVRAVGETEFQGARPVRLLGAFQDITARRAMESAVRRTNEVLNSVLESLPCGLSVFDGDLKLVAANPEFRRLLSLPETLFGGAAPCFEDIIRFNGSRGEYGDEDVEGTVKAIIDRARQPAVPHHFERTRPDGTVLEIHGGPMPNGGFVTTYVDVSERKRVERELQQRERLMRLVIDSFPGPLAHWDTDMRCTIANHAYRGWLGLDPAKMVGRRQDELFGEEMFRRNEPHILAALGGEEQRVERSRLVDGVMRHFFLHYLPDRDGEQIRGFISIVVDVSEMKQVQLQLQDRTSQAEQANVAKSQFLANMSHEIRTPMNAILGMLALLKKTDLSARQLDYAGKTEGAARSLLGLLNDILDFSKVEAGKMTLDTHPFRADQLLRDLSVILSANAGGKHIEVLFDIDPQLPQQLVGDALRLQQVLINLGGNAIKFTERGEVVVSVAVVQRVDAEVTLEFAVRDSGIGIAPENQQRIFSGFTQAEASTTRRFGGTGLGLAISQRMVGLMGGELRLDSELGKGSRFHFRIVLPVGIETEQDLPLAQPASAALRALIVDDNPAAREVLDRMVASMGWQADVADSGEAALVILQSHACTYDAVFVDWQMPGMDGWQTCQRIRELSLAGGAPLVVMVTAHGREMLSQRSTDDQALVDGFLVKPVTASMLVDAIAEARADRGQPGVPRRAAAVSSRRLAGMRLLVAEDNANNQQVVRELLEDEGARVQMVANGLEAIEAVAAAEPPFDVVLMDLQMPVMDGYTATSRIRQDLQRQTLPIVAMTANAMASDRAACLAAGMNDHIGKPFDLDELVATLLRHAGRSPIDALPGAARAAAAALPAELMAQARLLGIDLGSAVSRLGGRADVWTRTAQSFSGQLRGMADSLAGTLERGELVDASRLMHTLKGLASMLGAAELTQLASDAEQRLHEACAPDFLASLRQRALHQIDQTRGDFEALLQLQRALAPAAAAAPSTRDRQALARELGALAGLLGDADMAATDCFAALQVAHEAHWAEELAPLSDAVCALDFERALTECRILTHKLATA